MKRVIGRRSFLAGVCAVGIASGARGDVKHSIVVTGDMGTVGGRLKPLLATGNGGGADRRDDRVYRVKESDKFAERVSNKVIGGALFLAGLFALLA